MEKVEISDLEDLKAVQAALWELSIVIKAAHIQYVPGEMTDAEYKEKSGEVTDRIEKPMKQAFDVLTSQLHPAEALIALCLLLHVGIGTVLKNAELVNGAKKRSEGNA